LFVYRSATPLILNEDGESFCMSPLLELTAIAYNEKGG
jgi:hypothetical protein